MAFDGCSRVIETVRSGVLADASGLDGPGCRVCGPDLRLHHAVDDRGVIPEGRRVGLLGDPGDQAIPR